MEASVQEGVPTLSCDSDRADGRKKRTVNFIWMSTSNLTCLALQSNNNSYNDIELCVVTL